VIDLKRLAGNRWRISMDEAWDLEKGHNSNEKIWLYWIEGSRGHIYSHGAQMIGAWTEGRTTRNRLLALEAARLHRAGDREWTVVLSIEHLDAAAALIGGRKRRKLSREHRAKLMASNAATRFSRF
jgi:hypothetical protein